MRVWKFLIFIWFSSVSYVHSENNWDRLIDWFWISWNTHCICMLWTVLRDGFWEPGILNCNCVTCCDIISWKLFFPFLAWSQHCPICFQSDIVMKFGDTLEKERTSQLADSILKELVFADQVPQSSLMWSLLQVWMDLWLATVL